MIILYMSVDQVNLSDCAYKLLKYGLSKYYGINNPCIARHEEGKPYLTNVDNVDFNISHTKGMVICGITDNGKIGVDVEHNRKVHKNVPIKVYHKNEINYLSETLDVSGDRFFEIWTKKEAYTKYLGTGLRHNITDINMLSKDHTENILFWTEHPFYFSVYSDDTFCQPVKVELSDVENYFL